MLVRSCFLVLLFLGFTIFFPVHTQAQSCAHPADLTAPVFCYSAATMGAGTMSERKCFANLNGSSMSYRGCAPQFPTPLMSPTDFTGATYCTYIMGQKRLYAKHPTSVPLTMAFCQVSCDCGTLRLDEGDGLPVELLEFELD